MELKLPNIVRAEDYHEFYGIQEKINGLVARGKVTVAELGFSERMYVGLVYTGRKPAKAVVAELLKRHKIELE